MEKVLIISYFFPPCNLTASQRTYSWAKYLSRFGYRPVVITRRWDHPINTLSDVSRTTPTNMVVENNTDYDAYYLPYQGNLRDKIYIRYGERRHTTLRKSLTFFELLFQHFFTFAIPYSNMFRFAGELLAKDTDIKKVIVSGNPFNTFKIGYQLNRRFGTPWIADYRDAWTTSEINFINRSFVFNLLNQLDRHFEKEWVSTASHITASSVPIADNITSLTGTKSSALYNGFIAEDFEGISEGKYADFTITYVGTLNHGQKIEIFCEAFKRFVSTTSDIRTKLYFPGLAFYKDQLHRVTELMKGFEKYVECTPRMNRAQILEIEKRSHLLLHVAWDEQQGIIASKIYEYIASGTFILVTPTDNGSIHKIVNDSQCGICTTTVEETKIFLQQEYAHFMGGKFRTNDTLHPRVQQFSRLNQVKHLAELLRAI